MSLNFSYEVIDQFAHENRIIDYDDFGSFRLIWVLLKGTFPKLPRFFPMAILLNNGIICPLFTRGFLNLGFSILLITANISLVWASGENGNHPFRAGEKHCYEIRWGMIPAGQAELEVLPVTDVDGISAWHFQLKIRTNDFVDVFYKVRDKIDSHADRSVNESLLYRKSQKEGRSLREEVVVFDHVKNLATYSNHGKFTPAISLMPGTVDPLTAVFFIRTQELRENMDIVKPITDGKKNVTGVARVLNKERLVVDGITYDTFRVEPDLRDVGGVFEKTAKSRITLWFTADERRLLVKIEGKVVVGAFTGILLNRCQEANEATTN